jgi:hypothetical protein
MVDQRKLSDFLEESNRIENVFHVKGDEVDAAMNLMVAPTLTVDILTKYVKVTAPGAKLRDFGGSDIPMNMAAPVGGPHVTADLTAILEKISSDVVTPFMGHILFELLLPYSDANGRAGRLVWYWQMQKHGGVQRPFLQQWYYDSLRVLM